MSAAAAAGLLVGAVVLALWGGLLALAQEARVVARTAEERSRRGRRRGLPLYQAIQVARLTLIVLAATAAGAGLGWWREPALAGGLRAALSAALR
ncbi:MAG: hypothetical protein PVF27_03715, partial [Gemmatimonadales bacterium]